LRGQQTAHVIADAELDRLVRDLLRTVPVDAITEVDNYLPVSSLRSLPDAARPVYPQAFPRSWP